jgi:hydroxypyruvate reductase
MFDAAVAAADPMICVPPHLPEPPKGRLIVVGAGKASARMAQAVDAHYKGPIEGVVLTRYGHGAACETIEIIEASHPVPDAAGVAGTQEILRSVSDLTEDDLVLALISGGGSALLTAPTGTITLDEKRSINQALLKSGAAIGDMNTVRKHLSAVKGGGLAAAAYPARVLALMISDVPGDDPAVIASGPTVGTQTSAKDAMALLQRYGIDIAPSVRAHLSSGETPPKPDDERLSRVENRVIAAPQISLEAAAEVARKAGVTPLILSDAIEGESRDVAKVHAGIAAQVARHNQPLPSPCVLISGGETTVTVRGNGRGGRNVEFCLALAVALDGSKQVWAIAGDTDGIDGAEEIAGAMVTPDTLSRASELGIDPLGSLSNNDGHTFFEALGAQVITGPTLTNVNDFRAVLIT